MVAIPLPLGSAPGFESQEAAGRLLNCYAEPLGEGRGEAKRVRVPGMTAFLTSDASGFRGMADMGGTVFAAFENSLYRGLSVGGTLKLHAENGEATGKLPVYFARNNATPPGRIMVSKDGSPGAHQITDLGLVPFGMPEQPNSVFSLDGYIVFTTAGGKAYATGLNDLVVNALSFSRMEAKTDGLVRGVAFGGRALFFGTQSLEIWTDVGAVPFPFQRATVVPFGLLGPDAVAGWEDGFGAGLLWVANDFTVRALDGYTPVKVSSSDVERAIAREPSKASLLASVHVVDGHSMWTLSGTDFTWEFDLGIKRWHERSSWRELLGPDPLTGEPVFDYDPRRWRGLQSIRAFADNPSTTPRWLVGDRNSGGIYEIDPTNFTENGEPLVLRIESADVQKFPERIRVARADFHVEVGVGREVVPPGLPPGNPVQDPVAIISWSDDGGVNWSVEVQRKMGRQARYQNVSVLRAGLSTRHGRRWRIDISDPVYVAIFSGDQSAELRAGSTRAA
jgi:hypothetical protein